ncbi:hypothetical protein DOY81_010838 [Sarcophaga bullata]|nr:hypothetical protein DOY81_010838 [Sarcophaga bullata]
MKLQIYFLLFTLSSIVPFSWCIVNHVHDGIGWTNVDLVNFQYFKNLPSQDPKRAAHANLFLEHFQKKKAVLDYFENLFFGNSPFTKESEIPFDPHFGRAWRPYYVRKFGWRGERLIDALGKGYSIKDLKHFGAIPRDYGARYYPS